LPRIGRGSFGWGPTKLKIKSVLIIGLDLVLDLRNFGLLILPHIIVNTRITLDLPILIRRSVVLARGFWRRFDRGLYVLIKEGFRALNN
jgi:hypothetical protein